MSLVLSKTTTIKSKNIVNYNEHVIIKLHISYNIKGRVMSVDQYTYKLAFYETEKGNSPVLDFINELTKKAIKNKLSRKLNDKIELRLKSLRKSGTKEGMPHFDYITSSKYPLNEIRVAHNKDEYRILICPWNNNEGEHYFVLLHWFQKKTEKTHVKDIKLAESRMKSFLVIEGGSINENLG